MAIEASVLVDWFDGFSLTDRNRMAHKEQSRRTDSQGSLYDGGKRKQK